MSKKDYEKAAAIAQESPAKCREAITVAFTLLFSGEPMSRFDECRFRRACVPGANMRARGGRVSA